MESKAEKLAPQLATALVSEMTNYFMGQSLQDDA
jgi:hypothetical protein